MPIIAEFKHFFFCESESCDKKYLKEKYGDMNKKYDPVVLQALTTGLCSLPQIKNFATYQILTSYGYTSRYYFDPIYLAQIFDSSLRLNFYIGKHSILDFISSSHN